MKANIRAFVALSLIFASPILGYSDASSPSRYEMDSGQMPRCVWPSSGFGQGRGLLLRWNSKERYDRKIEYAKIEKLSQAPWYWDCLSWERIQNEKNFELRWTTLDLTNPQIKDYNLDSEILEKLNQVKWGGTQYRAEKNAEEFLATHPIANYDRKLNLELTLKYGAGFVSEIYRAWENQKSSTQLFREKILENIKKLNDKTPLAERFRGVRVMIANGVGNDPKDGRLKILVDDLKSYDLDVGLFETGPYATVKDNSASIQKQLQSVLDTGVSVIIINTSKAHPETLGALARIAEQGQNPTGAKVLAVISISGLTNGSVLANWAINRPDYFLLNLLIKLGHKLGLVGFPTLEPFKGLTDQALKRWYDQYAPHLPKETIYVDLIGTVGGNGLAKDPMIVYLQNKIIRKFMSYFGANDGYVEYPGTSIPDSWGLQSYRVLTTGSHPLTDGSWENYQIGETKDRRLFFNGIFQTLADFTGRN